MINFRYKAKQRIIARRVVKSSPGWTQWAAARGIVSRQIVNAELNQAIDDMNLRIPVIRALQVAKALPIWDRTIQAWVPKTLVTPVQVPPAPLPGPVQAPATDTQALLDLLASYEARIVALEIAAKLRVGDPHQIDDIDMQQMHVDQEYRNNAPTYP